MKKKKILALFMFIVVCAMCLVGCTSAKTDDIELTQSDLETMVKNAVDYNAKGDKAALLKMAPEDVKESSLSSKYYNEEKFSDTDYTISNVTGYGFSPDDISMEKYNKLSLSSIISYDTMMKKADKLAIISYKLDFKSEEEKSDELNNDVVLMHYDGEWKLIFDNECTDIAETFLVLKGPGFISALIGMFVVLAFMIIMVAYTVKRHGITGFGIFGGLGVYLVFYLLAGARIGDVILYFLPKEMSNLIGARVIIGGLTTAIIPILGRMLVMKVLKLRMENFKEALSYGLGIGLMEGLMMVVNLLSYVMVYRAISQGGWDPAKGFDTLASVVNVLGYTSAEHIGDVIWTIAAMVLHMTITLPLLGAFRNKISKLNYLIVMAVYSVFQMLFYMRNQDAILPAIAIVLGVLIAGAMLIYALRIHYMHFKKEEEEEKEKKQKQEQKTKKIPRFDNLSKL